MTFNNLPAVVLGVALIAFIGGCCTTGSCGSCSCSKPVCSAPSPAPTPAPTADCGCGCSAAPDSAMSYESSDPVVISDNYYSPSDVSQPVVSTESPTLAGEATSSVSAPTTVVEPPSINGTSGFTAGSATKAVNALPGNLLPGE